MNCDRALQVQAFYDGELDSAQRAQFEAHLLDCAECRNELAALRDVSSTLRRARISQRLPDGAIGRFDHAWRASQDRGVLRIASWLTAAASAAIVLSVVRAPTNDVLDDSSGDVAISPQLWQSIAIRPASYSPREESPGGENVVLAQWMADELSTQERDRNR